MATARRRAINKTDHRWDVELLGVKNGVNMVFTTPEDFEQVLNIRIRTYLNGQRLLEGGGNDYTVSESGGVGTGFDTVTTAVAPQSDDNLTADFVAV